MDPTMRLHGLQVRQRHYNSTLDVVTPRIPRLFGDSAVGGYRQGQGIQRAREGLPAFPATSSLPCPGANRTAFPTRIPVFG